MSNSKLLRDLSYATAVAIGAIGLQWALSPWLGWRLPFLLLVPAIIFTAASLGRSAATLVMLLGAANAALALAPAGHWLVADRIDRLAIFAYALVGTLLIAYGGRLQLRNRRAERAEQRLSLAQDETGVGLFELDYRAGTAYASPALCQILGQPVMDGSLPLQQWLDALNAGHVAESRRTLQQKVASGELRYERELRIERPNGEAHWLLSRIRLDLDERGKLAAARGATLDITARKQLVTELETTQSLLRQQLADLNRLHGLSNRLLAMPRLSEALKAILEAVCSFHDSTSGLLLLRDADGGARVAASFGLPDHALAQLSSEQLPEDEQTPTLRDWAATLGMHGLHMVPLVARGCHDVLGRLIVLAAENTVPDERISRLTDLCVGQAAALIEREQALSLAQEARHRFDVALQSSSVAFTILAPIRDDLGRLIDFKWTYANPAAALLIDRPAHDLVGQRILDVLPHAWDDRAFFDRYVQVSEQGCTAEFETLARRTDRPLWLQVILSPLNGSVVVWFADVTERHQQRLALEEADRRKDRFLATLAHELRNPLAPIRHAAAVIRNEAASGSQRDWSLGVIDRQLQQMAMLLDDLLDVSRITRGTLPLRLAPSLLRPIIETAVETASPLLDQRRHRLLLELPNEPISLDVDPLRLAQVVSNLLVNAAKYTEPGGRVVLSARSEGGELFIAVSDNGNGMPPEDCERVFEMFTQLPAREDEQPEGLGIGLALARNLVRLHGGSLSAHSPGLGLGSTFTVRIPLVPASAPSAASPGLAFQSVQSQGSRRILIADDNHDAADSLAMLLGLEGHEVLVAYDGKQAMDVYESFRPQVALLDMAMPQRSGTEVAGLIRGAHDDDAVTLVALTGFGQDRDRQLALEAGFDHHLTKPVQLEQLLVVISADR